MNADLHDKLNAETARVAWSELERHFARGATLSVGPELDLLEVAQAIARDDTERVTRWLAAGELQKTPAEQARDWAERDAILWCVVIAPWVLVSEN
ncbi:DUF2288 domain-containing protein [Ectothiorhodospiraceae bacterium WFHF3C12]|nr:DUF2288 domain-containing protein [Ectothiorhodospiraceae bacterium WFHF3C12]